MYYILPHQFVEFQKLSQQAVCCKGRHRLSAQRRLRSATARQPVGLLHGPGYTGAPRRASGHVCAALPRLGRTRDLDGLCLYLLHAALRYAGVRCLVGACLQAKVGKPSKRWVSECDDTCVDASCSVSSSGDQTILVTSAAKCTLSPATPSPRSMSSACCRGPEPTDSQSRGPSIRWVWKFSGATPIQQEKYTGDH